MSDLKKEVAVVVGDIGATKELVPAGRRLQEEGCNVEWYVDEGGKGIQILDREGIPSCTGLPRMEDAPAADCIVIGTSATAVEAQLHWTEYGKVWKVPVIWYEDLVCTGELPQTSMANPNVMLVTCRVAELIARRKRPGIDTVVVGKPTFEGLSAIDLVKAMGIKAETRKPLAISGIDVVVVYWGGGDSDRVKRHLGALREMGEIETSAGNKQRLVLIPRLHPKMPDYDEVWKFALDGSVFIVDGRDVEETRLNCAADVVIGEGGSTQCYVSALLGKRVCIPMWPAGGRDWQECGCTHNAPPLISEKCAYPLVNSSELAEGITVVVSSRDIGQRFQNAQAAFGDMRKLGADVRIMQAVMSAIGEH